jgi:hypothetical protein
MKIANKMKFIVLLLIALMSFFFISPPEAHAAAKVELGTADSFVILAGAHVTVTNISSILGDVGLRPATWALSPALTCAQVTGTIYSIDGTGPLPCRVTDDGLLNQAKIDLTTAFTNAGGQTPATVKAGSDNQLGGQTLTPGIYSFSHATTANIIGTLTLNTQGDPNAVFIFQAASDLITDSASVVQFMNGETCNVFWHVPTSATLGTGSNFKGTILADQSITDNGGSTVSGRLLARIVDVTINNTTITKPICAAAPTPTSSGFGLPGDNQSDHRSDGRSSTPAIGASTSTLAATGSNDQSVRIMLAVTTLLFSFLLGKALLRRHETS